MILTDHSKESSIQLLVLPSIYQQQHLWYPENQSYLLVHLLAPWFGHLVGWPVGWLALRLTSRYADANHIQPHHKGRPLQWTNHRRQLGPKCIVDVLHIAEEALLGNRSAFPWRQAIHNYLYDPICLRQANNTSMDSPGWDLVSTTNCRGFQCRFSNQPI